MAWPVIPFAIDAIVVLPDHLHTLWRLPDGEQDFSTRWMVIKRQFSAGLPAGPVNASKRSKREKGVWQRRFWEHLIRDERDFVAHVDYVHFNPVKHGWVRRVKDWEYSTFHRYVDQGVLPLDWAGGDANLLSGLD